MQGQQLYCERSPTAPVVDFVDKRPLARHNRDLSENLANILSLFGFDHLTKLRVLRIEPFFGLGPSA